jgi:hypothetical protein
LDSNYSLKREKTKIMKKVFLNCLVFLLVLPALSAQYRTERTGYDGDYFSLEGALALFQESRTLEDFERKLNTQDRWVNNLDLDYDGRTDYIRVEHLRKGNFHVIILQALVSRYEKQDVAVIEIELTGRQEAALQIIGDEDLFGQEVIVEPVIGYANSRGGYPADYRDYENVYFWPVVQDILRPQYTVYASPYRWQYYPAWWTAWRPLSWNVYNPRVVVYHRNYRMAPRLRSVHAHQYYRPHRSYSNHVVIRTNQTRSAYRNKPDYRPREDNRPHNSYPNGNVREHSNSPYGDRPGAQEHRGPSGERNAYPNANGPNRNNHPGSYPSNRGATPGPEAGRPTAPDGRNPSGERHTPSAGSSPSRNSHPESHRPGNTSASEHKSTSGGRLPAPKAKPEGSRH